MQDEKLLKDLNAFIGLLNRISRILEVMASEFEKHPPSFIPSPAAKKDFMQSLTRLYKSALTLILTIESEKSGV